MFRRTAYQFKFTIMQNKLKITLYNLSYAADLFRSLHIMYYY